ncbi:MAG: hypothetical protein AAGB48_07635 [Planctomycetota bacterium]
MDPRVADQFARARAARVRVVDLHARQGPVARFFLTAIGVTIMLLIIALTIAAALVLVPVILAVGLITAAVLYIRRRLATLGRPNERIAGVRTDGRDNVRVMTRD